MLTVLGSRPINQTSLVSITFLSAQDYNKYGPLDGKIFRPTLIQDVAESNATVFDELKNYKKFITREKRAKKFFMDRKDSQNSQGEAARILVEFLEVAITSIVFLKGIYPNGAFERRRYMNLVVHRASHPQLGDYISSAVNGLLPFIQKGLVERVAVIFFDNNNVPIERFVFKVNLNLAYGSKVEEADLEFALRSFLIKLPVSEPLTKVLPQGCRWEITAYFRDLPQVSTSKDAEKWIPTDMEQWQQPPLITPIKSMNSEPFGLQLYLEVPSLSEPKH